MVADLVDLHMVAHLVEEEAHLLQRTCYVEVISTTILTQLSHRNFVCFEMSEYFSLNNQHFVCGQQPGLFQSNSGPLQI